MNPRRRFFKPRQDDGAFSLVEVLIAMSILSVGLLAMAQMQITALKQNAISQRRGTVMTVAQEYMDKVVDAEKSDLATLVGTETVTRGTPPVTCTVTIAKQADGTPVAHSCVVEVTVAWKDGGMDKSFVMRTVKSEAESLQGA